MPEVEKCCCCISLRAGTITFGVLSLIGCFISMIFGILGMVCLVQEIEHSDEYDGDELWEIPAAVMLFVSAILLVIGIIGTLFNILLTCGAKQRSTFMLMTWIVLLWTGVIFDCIGSSLIPFVSFFETEVKVVGVVICVVDAVFSAYQLLVVHSYRKQILRENYKLLSC